MKKNLIILQNVHGRKKALEKFLQITIGITNQQEVRNGKFNRIFQDSNEIFIKNNAILQKKKDRLPVFLFCKVWHCISRQ